MAKHQIAGINNLYEKQISSFPPLLTSNTRNNSQILKFKNLSETMSSETIQMLIEFEDTAHRHGVCVAQTVESLGDRIRPDPSFYGYKNNACTLST